MNILLTGGAGYIGSHTAVVLSEAGHRVVLYDNFCNSEPAVIQRLKKIVEQPFPVVQGDVRNTALLMKTIEDYSIDAVMHFAGLKAVGESVTNPIDYYSNNVQGTISLVQAMQQANGGAGIKLLVFSSSATVYGDPKYLPIDEAHPTNAINPYGRSKQHIEEMLADLVKSDPTWRIASLRYFNPVGAHGSGLMAKNPAARLII